jgi:hypothetical protein
MVKFWRPISSPACGLGEGRFAPFEVIADPIRPIAGSDGLVFERVLTFLDVDPHDPLKHAVDFRMKHDRCAERLPVTTVVL